jgi:hypothetical protein
MMAEFSWAWGLGFAVTVLIVAATIGLATRE